MRARVAAVLFAVALVFADRDHARADEAPARSYPESHLHATLGVGHAVGDPQSRELSWGGQVGVAYELRVAHALGFEAQIDAYDLVQGDPPLDPRFAQRAQGFGVDGILAVRLRPFPAKWAAGPWLEAGGGAGMTGSLARPVLEARVGWDVVSVARPDLQLGPFVGFTDVVQPDDTLRPEDAKIIWAGLHIDIAPGGRPRARGDRDHDGVLDDEDACPDVPGIPTSDPKTNGCPVRADRDHDAVYDDEDACPDVPGVRSDDPKVNGCPPPPPDRDRDLIPDAEDACPDVPGVHTDDPKTNGCPPDLDRDKDGVLDKDDACRDVPGVHTNDPKTNGCPPRADQVRVEGDQILLDDVIHFDTGSPRVRRMSWPLVKKVADFIESTPDILKIDIEGHADEVGTSEYNLYLSRERAAAVKRLLVHFGVDPEKLTTHAYGEERPRIPGHDEEAHRANRRVEFTITHARPGTTPAQPGAPAEKPNGGP